MSFAVAIGRLLGNEGGYVNDPRDPGGETNWGISKRSYPNLDIKALTRDQAIAIYQRDFWLKVDADQMPDVLGFQALDFAVNSGIDVTIRKLQSAAGVADDGHWGPVTKAAVAAIAPAVLTFRFIAARLDFMRSLSNWPVAGKGWAGRIANDMRFAAQDLLAP
jgi:lysozyme family protein